MAVNHSVTSDCFEQLEVWLKAHCPIALIEEPELFPGLLVIIEEEVKRALVCERQRILGELNDPNLQ